MGQSTTNGDILLLTYLAVQSKCEGSLKSPVMNIGVVKGYSAISYSCLSKTDYTFLRNGIDLFSLHSSTSDLINFSGSVVSF